MIDFYLSHIVFSHAMREFPHKLAALGWDIAQTKAHPTTGFSGTNDSRYVLPLSIDQIDLPEQRHTNAAQLECLLRPENSYEPVRHGSAESVDAESHLQTVLEAKPPVRVILDVGARVFEWSNKDVAHNWLARVSASSAQAVVFFDDRNDLMVHSRDGVTQPLPNSSFAEQMDQCLVYLDQAHTRGTDLKLPADYRAAVTLGPGLTKDRLVQGLTLPRDFLKLVANAMAIACMRMRGLGKGQSVLFCGSREVERGILGCVGKFAGDTINVADVLHWSMMGTCIEMKRSIPL